MTRRSYAGQAFRIAIRSASIPCNAESCRRQDATLSARTTGAIPALARTVGNIETPGTDRMKRPWPPICQMRCFLRHLALSSYCQHLLQLNQQHCIRKVTVVCSLKYLSLRNDSDMQTGSAIAIHSTRPLGRELNKGLEQ